MITVRSPVALIGHFLFGANRWIDRGAFWTGVTALVALVGAVLALRQLSEIRRTSQADFAKRFNDTFFNSELRTLFTLLLNRGLKFEELVIHDGDKTEKLPYLRIREEISSQINTIMSLDPARKAYTGFEIDDLLLGPLDHLGWYVRRGLIDFHTAVESFEYYIEETVEHPEMQRYLESQYDAGLYENIRFLHGKMKSRARVRWWPQDGRCSPSGEWQGYAKKSKK